MEKDKITISLHDHMIKGIFHFENYAETIIECSCGWTKKELGSWLTSSREIFNDFHYHQKEMLNNQSEKVEVV